MKTHDRSPRQTPPSQADRNDRLKSALQANIARRKALARAKADQAVPADPDDSAES